MKRSFTDYTKNDFSNDGETIKKNIFTVTCSLDLNEADRRRTNLEKGRGVGSYLTDLTIPANSPVFGRKDSRSKETLVTAFLNGVNKITHPTPLHFMKHHYLAGITTIDTSGDAVNPTLGVQEEGSIGFVVNFPFESWTQYGNGFKVGEPYCVIPKTNNILDWNCDKINGYKQYDGKINYWFVPLQFVKDTLEDAFTAFKRDITIDGKFIQGLINFKHTNTKIKKEVEFLDKLNTFIAANNDLKSEKHYSIILILETLFMFTRVELTKLDKNSGFIEKYLSGLENQVTGLADPELLKYAKGVYDSYYDQYIGIAKDFVNGKILRNGSEASRMYALLK